jgi:hypothetical protein
MLLCRKLESNTTYSATVATRWDMLQLSLGQIVVSIWEISRFSSKQSYSLLQEQFIKQLLTIVQICFALAIKQSTVGRVIDFRFTNITPL